VAYELIPAAALFICQLALLVLFPVLLFAAGARLINGIQDARLPWTPYSELVALWIGVMAGVVILGHTIDPATLTPSQVFRVDGPWDIGFVDFLARHANPFRYDVSPIFPLPFSGHALSGPGLVVFFSGGAAIYLPILYFRSRRALANGIRNAWIMVCGAYVTVYGFALFVWLLNRLNFWVFLLLMLVIHLRSRSARIVLKLN
jgi:hypothetical protein